MPGEEYLSSLVVRRRLKEGLGFLKLRCAKQILRVVTCWRPCLFIPRRTLPTTPMRMIDFSLSYCSMVAKCLLNVSRFCVRQKRSHEHLRSKVDLERTSNDPHRRDSNDSSVRGKVNCLGEALRWQACAEFRWHLVDSLDQIVLLRLLYWLDRRCRSVYSVMECN